MSSPSVSQNRSHVPPSPKTVTDPLVPQLGAPISGPSVFELGVVAKLAIGQNPNVVMAVMIVSYHGTVPQGMCGISSVLKP